MPRIPKYDHHRPTGQARVRIRGKTHYLGKFGSKASREKYRQLIAEMSLPPSPAPDGELTVLELVNLFWADCKTRYVKDGKPTSEIRNYGYALAPVLSLYGLEIVSNFGPRALLACRAELIRKGFVRRRINQHVYRIRRCFQWGVGRELVSETTWRALLAVEGLRKGQSQVSDRAPIGPVPDEHVWKIEPFVSPQVWAMVQLQFWSGCRPQEATLIRACDLNMSGKIWEYRPPTHKTEHYDRTRIIFVGPKAQAVIRPFLSLDLDRPLFRPCDAREAWIAGVRKRDQTPSRIRKPLRTAREQYTVATYGYAIRRACKRAEIPNWSPNQLRHAAATRIRRQFGLEASQVVLGHAHANVTQIYAERDFELARNIAGEIG